MGCKMDLFQKTYLESLHTKQLLDILDGLRKSSIGGLGCADYNCEHVLICRNALKTNIEMVKEILKTRPHILNKKESKLLRKAKIKQGV